MNLVLGPTTAPPPRPARWPSLLAGIVNGLGLACIGWGVFAAELPTERTWVVWDVNAGRPWTSPKGYRATATGPTACSLALQEVSTASPSGTRLTCRQVKP